MPTIELDGQNVTYTLLLDKRRKNIQLRILSTAVVEIITPGKLAALDIEHIITSKRTWIKRRLSKLTSLSENPVNQQVASGSQILYLGEPHTLALVPGSPKIEVTATDGELRVTLPQSLLEQVQSGTILQKIIKAWLVDQAGKLLRAKTKEWADSIGVKPTKITIRDQKSRWGSCSTLGSINYNWRVIMSPLWVTDYLIIHELCHMLVPNHSSAFWEQVSRFCPNYKECRKWLTDNGKLLSRLF